MNNFQLKSSANRTPKLCFVTKYLPDQHIGGTPVALRNLMVNLDPERVMVIGERGRHKLEPLGCASNPVGRMDEPFRLGTLMRAHLNSLSAALRVEEFAPELIVATYPSMGSFYSGYLLSRRLKLPLIVYLFDLFAEARIKTSRIERRIQTKVFAAAKLVLSYTGGMSEFYRNKYGMDSPTLPFCLNEIEQFSPTERAREHGEFTIGYSGKISAARIEGLKTLFTAVGMDTEIKLMYFTTSKKEKLRENGVWRDDYTCELINDQGELLRRLSRCGCLFLSLPFNSSVVDTTQLSTVFGTKTFEYMLSGSPILMLSPGDFYNARYLSQRNAALVVDEDDPEKLKAAVQELMSNKDLVDRLTKNARNCALEFDGRKVSAQFLQYVQSVVGAKS